MRPERGSGGGVAAPPATVQPAIAQRLVGESARGAALLVGCFVLIRLIADGDATILRATQSATALVAVAAAAAALAAGWGRAPLTRQTWALIGVGCAI